MFSETEKKYMAGLLDADGSLVYAYNNGYLSLSLSLSMSESIDRGGVYAKALESRGGKLYTRKRDDNWAVQNEWVVRKRSDLEKLIPHLTKHMVVKGKKWQHMLEVFRKLKAVKISREEMLELREEANALRGPLKAKKHPTWAWVAGYIDGDGWYLKRDRGNHIEQHVGVVSHPDYKEGVELLHKAFGGVLKTDNKGYVRWIRSLGPRDKQFTISFLKKMVNHTHLKKWKIEQLLSTHSQRLSDLTPKGDAIV